VIEAVIVGAARAVVASPAADEGVEDRPPSSARASPFKSIHDWLTTLNPRQSLPSKMSHITLSGLCDLDMAL
jgi:hypothetical protein